MSFLTNLFGNTKVSAPQIQPVGFSGGGLTAALNPADNIATVNADPNRTAAVSGQGQNFTNEGDAFGGLLSTVAPGFNDLLKSRLTSFNNDASSAIGSLSQNLQSRRIQGSSFGADTITRAKNQFAQQRDAIVADNYLKSLQASTGLVGQKYGAYNNSYQSALNELNLESGAAQSLSSGVANTLAQNAQLQNSTNQFNATMSNNQATGLGGFLGKMIPGGSMGSLFGGLGGAAADSGAAAAAGMGTAADSAALLAELGPLAAI